MVVVQGPQHSVGPSKSVLACALHSLENVLGLARFRVIESAAMIYRVSFCGPKKNCLIIHNYSYN